MVLAELGGIDVLIANQGYARCAPIWETSMDDFQAIMNTNFYGHVRLVKAFVPAFRAQGSGSICLVASMLAFMSFYGYGPYSASKHAIVGFSEALRQEIAAIAGKQRADAVVHVATAVRRVGHEGGEHGSAG